ncbi:hypothetical protein Aple_090800 [Acrocarpospora pleiomorpha]|uniref:Uncharacterized protein n=1 Tax=Acrocarpospora pleiomorpha TaxID=90975 RepID=A0A5M3Y313_9ACTN|nr:hypothetical protein [Acrocarpospora pleiomorpha]GES26181.1 hypothetical protein Aple_090800 [Acrocarpospora pleiomorpha]
MWTSRRRVGAAHGRRDLLDWFDGLGLSRVDLNASPDGQGLYRSLGFADHPDPTLSLRHRTRGSSLRG